MTELTLIHALQTPFLNPVGKEMVVFFARWMIFALAAFILLLAVRAKHKPVRHAGREAIFAGLLALYFALLFSGLIHRLRPFVVSTDVVRLVPIPLSPYAFPSAHAASAFGLAIPILFAHCKLGWIAIAFAVLVSLGRVLGGVHYPTDVLSGILVGLFAFIIVRLMHTALRRTRFAHRP